MIIFGTRGVTYSAGSGEFFCPQCRTRTRYARKRVRRFFTLYFIPLIPLNLHREFVECGSCKGTYRMDVLGEEPEASPVAFQCQ